MFGIGLLGCSAIDGRLLSWLLRDDGGNNVDGFTAGVYVLKDVVVVGVTEST